jgi:hypothetical protein
VLSDLNMYMCVRERGRKREREREGGREREGERETERGREIESVSVERRGARDGDRHSTVQ